MRRAATCAVLMFFSVVIAAGAAEPATPLGQGRDIVELPSIGRVIAVFILVAAMAVGIAYLLRRYSPNLARGISQGSALRVIDRSTLNAGLRVHLIEVEGERILVAENRSGVSMLQLRRQPRDQGTGSAS